MTTRVVGRGKCPRCGMEGSVVFKELYNKVYVYVKHGRKWCYVGPLESVDLASIVTSLSDYHYFTTKINEHASRILGVKSVRVSALVFASILSIVVAYVASLSYGYPYEVMVSTALISQFSVILGVFTTLLAIALYEVRYKRRFQLGIPVVSSYPVLGFVFSVLVTLAGIVVSMPLRSQVEDYVASIVTVVRDHSVIHSVVFRFSLSSILLTSLVLAVVSKGLFNKLLWRLLVLVVSPILAFQALFYLALAMSGELTAEATRYLHGHSIRLGIFVVLLSATYLVVTSLLKRVLLLEQAQPS